VVETQDAAVDSAQTKVDAAYQERDDMQAALDLAHVKVDTAYEKRDQMQAALDDELLYLSSLSSNLAFHTSKLKKMGPY